MIEIADIHAENSNIMFSDIAAFRLLGTLRSYLSWRCGGKGAIILC